MTSPRHSRRANNRKRKHQRSELTGQDADALNVFCDTAIEIPGASSLAYEPLDETKAEIRILKIAPGDENDSVHCTLRHASCAVTWPDYTALSYCWGDHHNIVPITVNGYTVLVRPNLEAALRELRRRFYTHVWIDALCINQGDMDERNRQIPRMKDIYSKAAGTIAWLGPDKSGNAKIAFHSISLLFTKTPRPKYSEIVSCMRCWLPGSEPSSPALAAMKEMIELPYWERTWIIQELTLSEDVQYLWGRWAMNFETLRNGFLRLEKHLPSRMSINGWGSIAGILYFSDGSRRANAIDLKSALFYSAESKATDVRDKIFGILGLCSDGLKLFPSPDYHQSLESILKDLTIAQLRRPTYSGHSMDLICLDNPNMPKRPNFPSWVTDWVSLWRSPKELTYSRTICIGMRFEFSACGNSSHVLKLSDNRTVLVARGHFFDTIERLSPRYHQGLESEPPPALPSQHIGARPSPSNNPYGSLAGTYNAVWRTILCGPVSWDPVSWDPATAEPEYSRHFRILYSQEPDAMDARLSASTQKSIILVRNFLIHGWKVHQWAHFGARLLERAAHTSSRRWSRNMSDVTDGKEEVTPEFLIRECCTQHLHVPGLPHTRLMTTAKGYIGLSHPQAEPGDQICLLQGCRLPVILRPCDGGYRVVGETYVYGIMDGEFWNTQDESATQEFRLK